MNKEETESEKLVKMISNAKGIDEEKWQADLEEMLENPYPFKREYERDKMPNCS